MMGVSAVLSPRKRWFASCFALAVQASAYAYSDTKTFDFLVWENSGLKPAILWSYKAEAYALAKSGDDGPKSDAGQQEVTAPSDWWEFAHAQVGYVAHGEGLSEYELRAPGPKDGQFTGSIGVEGGAWVVRPQGGLAARASSRSEIGWAWKSVYDDKRGIIKYSGYHKVATTKGATSKDVVRDPIDFRFWDEDTGTTTLTDRLLQIDLSLDSEESASISIDQNVLSVDVPSGTGRVEVVFGSAFTTLQGSLGLSLSDGVVTGASTSGIFVGTLPDAGTPARFSSVIGSYDLEFDYTSALPAVTNADLKLSCEGMVAVPEPGCWLALGTSLMALALRRREPDEARSPRGPSGTDASERG